MSSATFRAVNKSGRIEDNSVIPFINIVKFREIKEHQNSICVIGGLGVTCSPRDPRFTGSYPWIFSGHKNPEHKSSGRDFNPSVTQGDLNEIN